MKRTTIALILILAFILPVHTTAAESRNYMAEIITALTAGDVDHARILNAERNAKIDSMDYCPHPKIDADDLFLLSKVMTSEAGSSWLSDDWKLKVGEVVLNRVASPEFPDTVYDVVYQRGQYGGVNSRYFTNLKPNEHTVKLALRLLEGERTMHLSVVFQAEFRQGSGTHTAYYDRYLGWVYFCYSSRVWLYEEVT